LESRLRCVWRAAAAVLALSSLGGCGGTPEDSRAADKRVSAEYLRTFLIDRDWQRWPEYFAPNATINGSDLALQIMRGTADGLHYSFTDLEITIGTQVAEPPRVATSFVLEGEHERPFNDQPATHRRLRIEGFAFDRLEGGKVVETRLYLDVWGLSQRAAAAAAGK
jgi:predicted ester cyclase